MWWKTVEGTSQKRFFKKYRRDILHKIRNSLPIFDLKKTRSLPPNVISTCFYFLRYHDKATAYFVPTYVNIMIRLQRISCPPMNAHVNIMIRLQRIMCPPMTVYVNITWMLFYRRLLKSSGVEIEWQEALSKSFSALFEQIHGFALIKKLS